ncbi:hypothetical protein ACMDCT_00005 [Halomonadaceae bacterium KBTZ08]
MTDEPAYTRKIDTPVLAVEHDAGLLSNPKNHRFVFWNDNERCARLYPGKPRTADRKTLALLDLGQCRFNLTMPTDRTLGEVFAEWWNPHRRRRVWRAGATVASEIHDVSTQPRDMVGTFKYEGTIYRVQRDIVWWPLGTPDSARISADNRQVATIEGSMESRHQLLIQPSTSLRLDAMLMAFHMYNWLFVGGGSGGGGAGGGGGGDGGGGC